MLSDSLQVQLVVAGAALCLALVVLAVALIGWLRSRTGRRF